MAELRVEQSVRAPRDAVWRVISDHEGMTAWSPIRRVTLSRPGAPDRNGVGAVRDLRAPGMNVVEEILRWDPPSGYEYALVKGAPVRDHRGVVRLDDTGGATRVTWTVSFRPLIPGTGWILRRVVAAAIADMLRRMAARVEAEPG